MVAEDWRGRNSFFLCEVIMPVGTFRNANKPLTVFCVAVSPHNVFTHIPGNKFSHSPKQECYSRSVSGAVKYSCFKKLPLRLQFLGNINYMWKCPISEHYSLSSLLNNDNKRQRTQVHLSKKLLIEQSP